MVANLVRARLALAQPLEGQGSRQHLLLALRAAPAQAQPVLLPDPIRRIHPAAAFSADLGTRFPAPSQARGLDLRPWCCVAVATMPAMPAAPSLSSPSRLIHAD